MRYLFSLSLVILFVLANNLSNAQKKLSIVGSSTSACVGPTDPNNCYVARLRAYFNVTEPHDTTIDNSFSQAGNSCYNGMPSSYVSPYSDPALQTEPPYNITTALAGPVLPDVVLVNFPTNGYDIVPVDSVMYCLRTIRDSANKKGIPCFVTTTQPRTNYTPVVRAKLKELKDSILLEMGVFAINFWDDLTNPADNTIALAYSAGDGVHLNDAGHAILAQRVIDKNIFFSVLPATFLQFNTVYKNNAAIISWATAKETDVSYYEIQRSADGLNFVKIATVNAGNNAGNNQYQYTDDLPLKDWNYYKILIVDRDGKKHASPVMKVRVNTGRLALIKTFASSASQIIIELQNSNAQIASFQLFNNMGTLISTISRKIETGTTTFYLNTPVLSNGVYHIKVSAGAEAAVSSFIKN